MEMEIHVEMGPLAMIAIPVSATVVSKPFIS